MRFPPEPAVLVTSGDYVDARSARDYQRQQAAAVQRMRAFDACTPELRRVWDEVGGSLDYARSVWWGREDD